MCFSSDPPPYVSRAHGKKARQAESDRITTYSREQIPRIQQASSALHAAMGITPGEQDHPFGPPLPRRVPNANEVMEPARPVMIMGPPPLPAPGMRSSLARHNVAGNSTTIPSTGSLERDMQLRGFYPVTHEEKLYQRVLQNDISYRDYELPREKPALLPRGTLTTAHSEPGDDTLGVAYDSPSIPASARREERKRRISKSAFEAVKPRKALKIADDQKAPGARGPEQNRPGIMAAW